MKNGIWFPTVLLIGSLFLIVHGLNALSSRAMRFPLIVGGITSILLLVEILRGIWRGRPKTVLKETKEDSFKELGSHLPAIAMLVAIVPLIWILGFLIAIPLHLFLFLKFNGEKWLPSFITGLVTWIILYFGLYLGMRIPFDEGLLFSYFLG
ncbi:MAG: tripartite tricarboxylate transporter TctB family protein [Thermodesulfobacteriota bacterium]